MAKYEINGKEVTEEEFNRQIFNGVIGAVEVKRPFYLDEVLISNSFSTTNKELNVDKLRSKDHVFKTITWKNENLKQDEKELLEQLKNTSHTGGSVFEKVQDSTLGKNTSIVHNHFNNLHNQDPLDAYNAITGHSTRHKSQGVKREDLGKGINNPPNSIKGWQPVPKTGKKESKTVEKAPVFTYCKQMKNAIEALSLRSLAGHKKYEKGDDWENFSRVENGDFEYSNAEFRHALGIGEDSDEDHLIAAAWNAVSRLEIHLRNKNSK